MTVSTKWMGSSLCMLALLLAASQASANLITNPGFETGDLTGWLSSGLSGTSTITVQSPDNGPTAPGTHHAFLDNRAEANGLTLKQTTAAGTGSAGTVYYFFDLKLGTAANGGVFFVEIFAENSNGAVIGGSGLLGNYTPGNWTTFGGSFNAPAGTDHFSIQFEANTGAVTGSVSSMRVDNVFLDRQPPTSAAGTSWGRLKALYR